jgi:hypothetical protein
VDTDNTKPKIVTRQVRGGFEPVEAPNVLTTVGWPVTFASETYPDDAQWLIDHGYYLPVTARANNGQWGCRWELQTDAHDRHHTRLTAHAIVATWLETDLGTKRENTAAILREQQVYAEARGLPIVAGTT